METKKPIAEYIQEIEICSIIDFLKITAELFGVDFVLSRILRRPKGL